MFLADAELCKGSTTDSDSVCEGSNPSPAAIRKAWNINGSRLFYAILWFDPYSSKIKKMKRK